MRKQSDAWNSRGNWKHLIITQTVPEQHTGNARNQRTTRTAILDTVNISEIVNLRVQNIFPMPNIIMCSADCKYEQQLQIYVPQKHFFFD